MAGRHYSPDDIVVTMARIESKIDTALQVQKVRDEVFTRSHQDINQRLQDHEIRIRYQEGRRYVEPKTVWIAVGVLVSAAAVMVAIINSIVNSITR